MSARQQFIDRMRVRLDEVRAEIEQLEQRAGRAETRLEGEFYTRLDELKAGLDSAEQKFELFRETHDHAWEEFRADLEQSWSTLRELIKSITAP